MDSKNVGHSPLDPAIADRLLTLLASDDAFRDLFAKDPAGALEQLGVTAENAASAVKGQTCLCTSHLASKEEIAQTREALLGYLTAQGSHTVVHAFESGQVAASLRKS